MGYVILLHGSLGAGKSTCAAYIAQELKGQRVVLDDVLTEHSLDDAKENSGCISPENFIAGIDIVLPQMREWLEQGEVVVVDGCFYHEHVVEHLLESISFPCYVFTLQVPLEVCLQRDADRAHPLGETAARAVYGLVSHYQFGIPISASGTLEETCDAIFSHLPRNIEAD